MTPQKFERMVLYVLALFEFVDPVATQRFTECPKSKLFMNYRALQLSVIDKYDLWDETWNPVMVEGCDLSPDHPHELSLRAIEQAWERMQPSKS